MEGSLKTLMLKDTSILFLVFFIEFIFKTIFSHFNTYPSSHSLPSSWFSHLLPNPAPNPQRVKTLQGELTKSDISLWGRILSLF